MDESKYQRDEIRRVFELIQKDTISPEERAKTPLYHLEEGKRTANACGVSEGVKKGLEEGVKKGLEEGVKKGYIETAKKLLAMDMDIATEATATGLTLAEVLALQNEF